MIEFQPLTRAALYTLSIVALPDEQTDTFGYRLAWRALHSFDIFKRFYFSAYSFVIFLAAKYMMLDKKKNRILYTVSAGRLHLV